jgi:hypothetical protein
VRLIVLDSITALFRAGDSLQFDDSDAAVAAAAAAAATTGKPSSSAATASLSSSTLPAVTTSGRYLSQRAIEFFKLSAHLRRLSAEHNMPIVIVNQVTDLFEPDARGDSSKNACSGGSSSSSVAEFMRHQARRSSNTLKLPALGLSWANCVNARIFLTRGSVSRPVPAHASSTTAQHAGAQNQLQLLQKQHPQLQQAQPPHCDPFELDAETEAAMHLLADAADANGSSGGVGGCSFAEEAPAAIGATEPRREMHVIFSPLAPMRAMRFTVTHDGVRGIPSD